MLICKNTWGVLLLLLTLSLMGEFIYLLCPLRSVVPTSNPSGHPHTIVYLEQGVNDHLLIICRYVRQNFYLFGVFGNNTFSSAAFPTGGNLGYEQPIPMQGTIPA
jgi:hypothetical protein